MNQNDYKAAFDSVKFSENFEQETIEYLHCAAESKTKKERYQMKIRKFFRTPAIVATLVAVLLISAFAVWTLLSPKEVATKAGDFALADAFDSADAVVMNRSVQTGEYTVTLGGIVSGKGLTDYCEEAQEDKSYIVASVAYTDGREIKQAGDVGFTFTPLVSGFKPWRVNAWTLSGGYSSFVYEGVNYFLFECSNIEIFADHTVYLAAYQGSNAPSAETFTINENGEISFAEGFDAPHAMFTLPLDSAKANPTAVSQLLAEVGITE